jgi:hypothetical protein
MSSDLTIRTVNDADTAVAVQAASNAPATGAAVTKAAAAGAGAMSAKTIAIAVGVVLAVALLVGGLAGGLTAGPSSGASKLSNTQTEGSSAITVSVGESVTAGGYLWKLLRNDLKYDAIVTSHDGSTVYLMYESFSLFDAGEAQVYRSTNYGEGGFTRIDSKLTGGTDGPVRMYLSPDASCVVAGTEGDKVFVSKDGGETFASTSLTGLQNTRIVTASDDCSTIIVGCSQCMGPTDMMRSTDGGRTFSRLYDVGPTKWFSATCDSDCQNIVVVTQVFRSGYDNFPKHAHVSTDSGASFNSYLISDDGALFAQVCVDRGMTTVFATSDTYRYISTDAATTFQRNNVDMTWTSCSLSADPSTGNVMTLLAGNQKEISKSTNLGSSWNAFSIDGANVRAIACDFDCATIYVATNDGVYVTRET